MGSDKDGLVGQWNAAEEFVFVVRFWRRWSTGWRIFARQRRTYWRTIGIEVETRDVWDDFRFSGLSDGRADISDGGEQLKNDNNLYLICIS